MATSKHIKNLLGINLIIVLFISCNNDKYDINENLYDYIRITNFPEDSNNHTIELFYYKDKNKFQEPLSKENRFTTVYHSQIKALDIKPEFNNTKSTSNDFILKIDHLTYRFTNVYFKKDTITRPLVLGKHYYIFYSLHANINEKHVNYSDSINHIHSARYISLNYKIGCAK